MRIPYATEDILIRSEEDFIRFDRSVYFFLGIEQYNISADIEVKSESIQFRIDGGNPSLRHCMFALEYCTIGYQRDSITLENTQEVFGFTTVKATNNNALISVIFYKEQL